MSEIEKKDEMDKAELVYVVSLMLDMTDYTEQIRKLSKPSLFRLYDGISERGNQFANLELRIRELERKNTELLGANTVLERDKENLFAKLKKEVYRNKGASNEGNY